MKSSWIHIFILLLFLLSMFMLSGDGYAVQPSEMLGNPQLEARARNISEDLRCLVCQNQSIDDSDADLAHDLRLLVRQRLLAGDSNEQVKQYLVSRYGDYVLLNPPFKASTVVLWLGPPFFFLAALFIVSVFYRRRHQADTDPSRPLSSEEQQRLAKVLDAQESNKGNSQ